MKASLLQTVLGVVTFVAGIVSGCCANLYFVNKYGLFSIGCTICSLAMILHAFTGAFEWMAVGCAVFGAGNGKKQRKQISLQTLRRI